METRKVRTPSARMLAAKQDEEAFEKAGMPIHTTPKPSAVLSTLQQQMARANASAAATPSTVTTATQQQIKQIVADINRQCQQNQQRHAPSSDKEVVVEDDDEEDVESTVTPRRPAHSVHHIDEDIEVDPSETVMDTEEVDPQMIHDESGGLNDDLQLKQEKMNAHMVMNGDFSVESEVTISSIKYQGRPSQSHANNSRKVQHYEMIDDDHSGPTKFASHHQRSSNFTGETLNLKTSDLSVPNKAAHFLYFRCYEEHEVQKEFPLTIDEHRKGPQNFLVEPRVGLKNTDYYIDSYLWNRGKSTSSKKKIFVEIDGNHVKTSRRACESAHYVLNWYYSNMENRICKKVCWLETVADCVRASPVLVQYHVNYLSDNPIELRKTPKLYSDTRSVAQELLRSDSPLQTVQRFVETGETDPREIINKKQAYEMRRYVMANQRKRVNRSKYSDDFYIDDNDMFEEVYYNEHGEQIVRNTREPQSDLQRIAAMAVRMEGRKIEHRIARMLEVRLGPTKNHAEMLSEWINTLEGTTAEEYDLIIPNLVGSMRKQLDEMLGEHPSEYIVETAPSTSQGGIKRMKIMDDDEVVHEVVEEVVEDHGVVRRRTAQGDRYIYEGQEYVEEEVITEEIEEVVEEAATSEHPSAEQTRVDGTEYFFEGPGPSRPSTSNGPSGSVAGPSRPGNGGEHHEQDVEHVEVHREEETHE
ncbi:hypothetical protein CAEBREN_20704 [Caenorhabditis brenneri]|uniref:Uncharacterized protein n=1 Tax=Caenorhabditis brenneri TaxID=135651 RepID=G0NAC3_CAEBE|nr:hypothetical protein CAEBREN_20704 [Caenorhabditis brenneri]